MPDKYESDAMKGLRRDYPHLFKDEEDSAPETAPEQPFKAPEPKFNTPLGKAIATNYRDQFSRKWFDTQRRRVTAETGGSGETYLARMRRLYDRYPEVQRLNREQISMK